MVGAHYTWVRRYAPRHGVDLCRFDIAVCRNVAAGRLDHAERCPANCNPQTTGTVISARCPGCARCENLQRRLEDSLLQGWLMRLACGVAQRIVKKGRTGRVHSPGNIESTAHA